MRIYLGDVSWSTSDIHNLINSLRQALLMDLVVEPACKLRSSPPSVSPTSQIIVDHTEIKASLSINTLVALLSHIAVDELQFSADCQVTDMSSYSSPSPQVSH